MKVTSGPRSLPAQFSPAFGLCVADFNGDGAEDLYLGQNFGGMPPDGVRQDAGRGLVLQGDGRGGFQTLDARVSGIRVYGDQRGAVLAAQETLGGGWIELVPAPSQEEQLRLLAEATLAVSPALYGESFGIVLAEAMASGTPVIGADNAGYRTVLTGRGASLLVPAGDGAALARRITGLLADAGERRALSDWGRMHARQFDVTERIADFEDFYAAAIARHARSKRDG